MDHRKDIYVERLSLISLSEEGGYFGETYRSPEAVQMEERKGDRSLFTTIYYLMVPELGGKNYFHSNKSDITHYFHDGWPAKYIYITREGHIKEYILGRDILKGHVLQLRVPGNCLKAAKILVDADSGEYAKFPGEEPFTLISEEMSSGFDYRDRHVPTAFEVKAKYPELWLKLEEYCAPGEE